MIDYYQILGVHPSATLDEIKRAYRQKALQCHPDRGGTHAQMLEINEAFGVLEDAELRQQYDYARAHNEDRKAQQQAATASQRAREAAENYPRQWSEFETWLKSDFKNARYGSTRFMFWEIPTASNSLSASTFIIGGTIIGAVIYLTFFSRGTSISGGILGPIHIDLPYYVQLLRIALSAVAGAWIGRWIHSVVGAGISNAVSPSAPAPPVPTETIIQCPHCSQKIRTPSIRQTIRITCSSCKHVFTHSQGI